MVNINKTLKKFILYLQKNKNFSNKTIKAYTKDILLFLNFLITELDLSISVEEINVFILQKVQEKTIYAFLAYLNYYRNNTASSRRRRLMAIKRFYKWLYLYYPSFSKKPNPIQNIVTVSNVVRLPKCLNLDQAKLIQNVFNEQNCKNSTRNNAIITLFLHTGIRISELVNLSITDINFNSKTANIIAKGNIERIIFLNDYTIIKLEKYLKTRRDDCSALFISSKKKRISTYSVNDICKKAFKLIGISNTSKYSAHTLRHTAATIVYKNNDILTAQEFLGHKSINTTEMYTHIINEDLKNAVNKNPLADFICFKKLI